MEQIQELFEILKSTPQMAIYGLLIWCLYILLKLASVVYALKVVFQLAINKWHDYKVKSLANKRGIDIAEMFEDSKIGSVNYSMLIELLSEVKIDSTYIHESDLRKAIKAIKDSKKK